MKREAGSGLKLGTRTKLEQNRAECRRERKGVSSCVFPVPPTHSEEKWSTTFLWKRIFLLKMASKGLSLKPLCALGSLSHTGRLHCVSCHSFSRLSSTSCRLSDPHTWPWHQTFLSSPKPRYSASVLGKFHPDGPQEIPKLKSSPLQAQPSSCVTYVNTRANQDKRLKSSPGPPHPVSSPFLGPISYQWGGLCSPREAALQLQPLYHLGLISCHNS